MPMPRYMKRYFFRLGGFITAYAFVLILGLLATRAGAPVSLRVFFSFVTAAMICGMFWAIFRLLSECDDEYQRMLLVKQVLLGTAITLMIVTFWQFLEVYEVLAEGPRWVGVLWLAMFGVAAPIARWRA